MATIPAFAPMGHVLHNVTWGMIPRAKKDQEIDEGASMRKHIVIDGNAFYEVDEECMERMCRKKEQNLNRPNQQRDQRRSQNNVRYRKQRPGF